MSLGWMSKLDVALVKCKILSGGIRETGRITCKKKIGMDSSPHPRALTATPVLGGTYERKKAVPTSVTCSGTNARATELSMSATSMNNASPSDTMSPSNDSSSKRKSEEGALQPYAT
jgi:hypothetical protein